MTKGTNIVLITADSVRRDHLGLFGYDRDTTPNLEQYNGTAFTNAYSNAPYTALSLPSMLTGKYPLEVGHIANNRQPTIQERLSDTEFTTCIAHSNIQLQRFDYEDQGDELLTYLDDLEVDHRENPLLRFAKWGLNRGGIVGRMSTYARDTYHRFSGPLELHPPDGELVTAAADWVEETEEPYFLWLHLMDTHTPYTFDQEDFEEISSFDYDPKRYARLLARSKTHKSRGDFVWELDSEQRQYIIDAYDASIRHIDRLVDDFLSSIELDQTTVLFSSDHGEELWDHGHFGHSGGDVTPRPLGLYEEVLQVPLYVFGAGVPDQSIDAPVSLIDIYPTIEDLTGLDITSENGVSLSEVVDGDRNIDPDRPIVSQCTVPGDPVTYRKVEESYRIGSIKEGKQKYIYNEQGSDSYYDIASDPDETNNIVTQADKSKWINTIKSYFGTGNERIVENDDAVKEHLQELGYIS